MLVTTITERELEVLRLVAYEYSNREIASLLHIAVGTVETHRKNLFQKLGAKNMAGLIKRAFDNGTLIPQSQTEKQNIIDTHGVISNNTLYKKQYTLSNG